MSSRRDGFVARPQAPGAEAKQHRRKPQHSSYGTTELFKHVPSLPTRCYFKVSIDNLQIGDIVIELFGNEVPKTCENFRTLCTGEAGVSRLSDLPLHYEGTIFHRAIAGFMIQGGDFTAHNGTGGESIWGVKFPDESFKRKHDVPYLLSMANCGANTNGSQFFITCAPCPHLDDKHVVFGRVIEGQNVVRQIEEQATDSNDRPIRQCRVTESGELVPQISTSSSAVGTGTIDAGSINRRSSRRDKTRRSASSSSDSLSNSSSSSASSGARALRKSIKERKRLERKLAKKLKKRKRRMLKKLQKKMGKDELKKHGNKSKRSPSASSSSESDSDESGVEKRRKRKHKKKDKKKREENEELKPKVDEARLVMQQVAPAAPKYYCTIDPAEIPAVPEPKFLRRRATPPSSRHQLLELAGDNDAAKLTNATDTEERGGDDGRDSYYRGGTYQRLQLKPTYQSDADHKRHKGRGDFFYGRGTPERWHQAERRLTKLPDSSRAEGVENKFKRSSREKDRNFARSPDDRRTSYRRDDRDEESHDKHRRHRSRSRDSDSDHERARRPNRKEADRGSQNRSRRSRSRRSIGEISSSSSRDTAYSGRSSRPRHTLQSVIVPIDNTDEERA